MRKFYGPAIPGSISPVPATEDMTEPVGIKDGQLWTKGPDGGLEDRVSALEDSVEDINGTLEVIVPEVNDHDGDIDNLKDRMDSAESNIGSLAGDVTQLQYDLGQAEGNINALGISKLDKPENTGDVGDVIVKTATGTEYQPVAPFNPNGTYPGATVGTAVSAKSLENVSEDSGATQDEPFFFQATATENNTAETPTAPTFELKKLKGNTIVYNQLVDGVNLTYPTISGHKYWVYISATNNITIVTSAGTAITVSDAQKDKIVDITRWFNGSIPQAILDDPTVFPINYYDDDLTYSAGELKNCSCTELKTVGFNQWDEESELGYYNTTTGLPVSSTTTIRCKNAIVVLPSTDYYFCCTSYANDVFRILWYDADNEFISANSNNSDTNKVITSPSNARYMRFYCSTTYGTTYNHDICINLHWDGERDGTYEPYTPHTYPMVYSGKSAGTAYDEKLPDGTEITAIGAVKAKSISWTLDTTTLSIPVFRGNLPADAMDNTSTFIISNNYAFVGARANLETNDKAMARLNTTAGARVLLARDSAYNDATAFTNHFTDDDYIYYWLATPTTASGDAFTSVIEGDDYGTMAFDSVVPVGNEFFYPADYVLLIDDLNNYTNGDVTNLMLKTDLPTLPTVDGHYQLAVEVTGGVPTLYWEVVS